MTYQYSYFRFDGELEFVRSAIEAATGLALSERDSFYWGGTYFLFADTALDFRVRLHHNIDDRGKWINPEFEGSHLLCSVSGPVEPVSNLVARLADVGGLLLANRTREITDDE